MRGFSMFLRHTFGPAADIIAGGVLMVCGLGLIAWVLIEEYSNSKKIDNYTYDMQKIKMLGIASLAIFLMGAFLLIFNL